jgi:two-component system sensor histidine kinase BarA
MRLRTAIAWLVPGKLSARLTLLVSFTAGLSVLIAVSAMLLLGWRSAESRARADARQEASSVAFSLAAPLAFQDEHGTREALGLLSHRTDVLAAWVRDAGGNLLLSQGAADVVPVSDGGGLRRGEVVVTAPVHAGLASDLVGTVTLRIDLEGARQELRSQVLAAGLATLFVLLLTVLLARQMARRMSIPVVRLAESAAALARDWSHPQRLQVSGPGEIGVAVDAFNHMVDELARRDAAVRQLTNDLREAAGAAEVARAQAESASLAKTRFLANMSHELRSPLNGVIGAAQLLQKSDRDPAFRAELIRIIQTSGGNLLELIEGVLDISRIEAGGVQTEQQPFDLLECLESALAPTAANAAVKGLAVEFRLEPDVPAWVVGDAARVKQLLQNLLGNAVKFSDSGTVTLEVMQGTHDGLLQFCVSDTGVGIPAHLLETIFQPFQQGDPSTTRRFGGSGLGLTICREIARLLHGEVHVESRPGAGSRFTLCLPLPAAPHVTASPAFAQLSLYCYEPGAARRRHLAALLARFGCAVRFFNEPGEIHAAVAALTPAAGAARAWLLAVDSPQGEMALQAVLGAGERHVASIGGTAASAAGAMVLSRPLTPSALQKFLSHDVAGSAVSPAAHTFRQRILRARVLVVEDDPVNQLVVRSMIEGSAYDCVVADGGAVAMRKLANELFDVVLMDWQMPDMDGLEVTRLLRAGMCGELNRCVPVIALTANAFAEDRSACLAAGMNDFLTKPVQAQQLLQSVGRWCRLQQSPDDSLVAAAAAATNDPAGATPEPAHSADQIYDVTVLAGLADAGDAGIIRDLLAMFRENSRSTLAAMEVAAASGDWDAVRRRAHTMKGSAGQIGAAQLAKLASGLEARLRGGTAGSLRAVEELRSALERFEKATTPGQDFLPLSPAGA